jgi:hypothetical protein
MQPVDISSFIAIFNLYFLMLKWVGNRRLFHKAVRLAWGKKESLF